ncbi:peptidase M24 [Rhodotorula diobovata]|uniref:Peptidase M24 n=1 Tax=Rhodotorula diobovata TaxID=5288 RepID=A0A5C5G5U6_9BASI|nr:peptidase M24 [Rhodotorula diobovata]
MHPSTHAQDRSVDWSFLHHSRQCPHLDPVGISEFTARRARLARTLSQGDAEWAAYVSEPSANTLYYLNVTQAGWYLSERPWLAILSPPTSNDDEQGAHLSVLTPAFELSRSQRLPFALTSEQRASVDWVTWEEADDPYEVLMDHLAGLRGNENESGTVWSVEVEENVRTFVRDGLAAAAQKRGKDGPQVGLAKLGVRELRMRKTAQEGAIQHCAAKITVEALRAVRRRLRVGMTEKEGEALITNALHAGGLTDVSVITLFGDNAALPHASASPDRKLKEDEFALFDVGGSLFGYESDFTRTMLPDPPASRLPRNRKWPSARAERVWTTVHRAQQAALDALLTPNESSVVYAADVDRAARGVIEREGWGQYFTHRLGHGIGLEVHEHPYLNGGNTQQALLPGETFSNEPGVYIERAADPDPEGHGIGVRLEDMVRKTERGWELVSREPLAQSPWEP